MPDNDFPPDVDYRLTKVNLSWLTDRHMMMNDRIDILEKIVSALTLAIVCLGVTLAVIERKRQ